MLSTEAPSTVERHPAVQKPLPTYRVNLMRVGYLVMGVGVAVFKWPLLPHVASLPVFEGVVVCMLTGMSLLAFLGLRYPVRMLPILLFESAWKLIWLAVVALRVEALRQGIRGPVASQRLTSGHRILRGAIWNKRSRLTILLSDT